MYPKHVAHGRCLLFCVLLSWALRGNALSVPLFNTQSVSQPHAGVTEEKVLQGVNPIYAAGHLIWLAPAHQLPKLSLSST